MGGRAQRVTYQKEGHVLTGLRGKGGFKHNLGGNGIWLKEEGGGRSRVCRDDLLLEGKKKFKRR